MDKIPHEVTLEVSDFRDASFSKSVHFKCSNIERNVIGKVGFLKDFVKSRKMFGKLQLINYVLFYRFDSHISTQFI